MGGTSGPGAFDSCEFENMVEQYRVILFKHIHNHIFNDEDVKDIYQETLFAAYRMWDRYAERGKRLNWLFGISNHYIRMWQRKNLPRRKAEVSMEEVEGLLQQIPAKERGRDLEEMLTRSVTPDERVALIQFYQKERSVSDIAQALGSSQAAIKKRLERGRNHLRNDLRYEQKNE